MFEFNFYWKKTLDWKQTIWYKWNKHSLSSFFTFWSSSPWNQWWFIFGMIMFPPESRRRKDKTAFREIVKVLMPSGKGTFTTNFPVGELSILIQSQNTETIDFGQCKYGDDWFSRECVDDWQLIDSSESPNIVTIDSSENRNMVTIDPLENVVDCSESVNAVIVRMWWWLILRKIGIR